MPALTSVWLTRELEDDKDLADLVPRGGFVAAKALEGAVVEIGKTDKAARVLRALRQSDGAGLPTLPIRR
jgi:hypothetical protein